MGCVVGIKCLVALQSHDNRFIVAEENGQAIVKTEKRQNSEIFEVIFNTLDKLQFKGYHKKYLGAEPDGTVNAKQNTNHARVTWTAVYKGKEGFAFMSYNGKYLGTEANGALNAKQSNAGLRELFNVIKVKGKKALHLD